MKWLNIAAFVAALAVPVAANAQPSEQYIPIPSYRVGPYGAGGASFFGGIIDYLNLTNAKGGINGVKIIFDECETEFNTSRGVECYERMKSRNGGASLFETGVTGVAYALLDRLPQDKIPMTTVGYGRSDAMDGRVFPWVFPLVATYWSQAAAMIQHLGKEVGGLDKLRGKKIVDLYHDSAYGKESFPVLEHYAKALDFELIKIPVPSPGIEQQSQWVQIRQARPDFVILWGYGAMNAAALKAAARVGYPREKILGSWWAGTEEDVIAAGDAAKGYQAMSFVSPGNYPMVDEIRNTLYAAGKGNLDRNMHIGGAMHYRGLVIGVLMVEAIRAAQEQFGKGKVMTAEQVRQGYESLNLDASRQKELGIFGMLPEVKTSCRDHEGSGMAIVQQWDGSKFVRKGDWILGDRNVVRKLAEESAAQYAAEKKIVPRDCK